jgi:hypothetical protein
MDFVAELATDPDKTFDPSLSLPPGVYDTAADVSLVGTLQLSGVGPWIFRVAGALTTAAFSNTVFVDNNGDTIIDDAVLADKVFWKIFGSATIGAGVSTNVKGTIMASGAITLGASATCGALLSSGGAITMGAGATCSGALLAVGAISLGAGASAQSVTTTAAVTLGAGASAPAQPVELAKWPQWVNEEGYWYVFLTEKCM